MTKPLSPAAQAIMVAATNGNFNVVNDPVYKQCIAAAMRAAVYQMICYQSKKFLYSIADAMKLLAIAAELEALTE
jgi:hypothetical protein